MKPVVDRLRAEYGSKLDFYVYDEVNSDPIGSQSANEHGVTAIPTMMVVAPDGTELDRLVGGRSEQDLKSRFDAALGR
ncbi:MAG: hypothetical protein CVT60_01675 [Actinobacteria bacterium HGW-Actinobacteria-10]|jgi:thiol-disulfide isomerase/thioredoxin|nr:MAG: hypothetical protein CVT60_01675 [Actinobacteria bacterium HGW-Actinobacteria-10]